MTVSEPERNEPEPGSPGQLDAGQLAAVLAAAREFSAAREALRTARRAAAGRELPVQSLPARAMAAEYLAGTGADIEALERRLEAARPDNRRRLEEVRADALRRSGGRADQLAAVVRNHRALLESVVAPGPPTTVQYIALDSPVGIWATDQLQLSSSSIVPWDSRAKIRYEGELYGGWRSAIIESVGTEELHFYYLWQNQGGGVAVVNVDGFLVLNGLCTVHSRGGMFDGGSARLGLDPTLELIQTWTQPISSPAAQPGQTQQALDLAVDSGGWFSDDHTKTALVHRGFDLRYEQAIVPAGQYLIIDVALAVSYGYINGAVSADFASAAFDVLCPFVEIAILPQPQVFRSA